MSSLRSAYEDFCAYLRNYIRAKCLFKNEATLIPHGCIMWFYLNAVPDGWILCDGTNGTPDLIGRYPIGDSSNIVNASPIEAGLPNITGGLSGWANIVLFDHACTGAIQGAYYSHVAGDVTVLQTAQLSDNLTTPAAGTFNDADFDASRSSSIYGKSGTVTPPSIKLLPCMKL